MLADEEAGIVPGGDDTEYAEGEWVENAETGELEWHPAEGGPALTAEQWEHAGDESQAAAEVAEASTESDQTATEAAVEAAEEPPGEAVEAAVEAAGEEQA
jgi:hypothetical protein